jgi:hypothetical protein
MRNGAIALPRPIASPVVAVSEASSAWMFQLMVLAAHVPLGLMIHKHSKFGTLHALAVLGLGLVAGVLFRRRPELVAYAAAYITGGAVYWRMRASPYLPWEFGKYALFLLFAVAIVFSVRIRRPVLPIAYFALLVPSIFLTMSSALPPDELREQLSFNLSGPFALAAAVLFFSSIRLTPAQLRWLMTALLAPIVSVATVAAYSLSQALSDPDFEFYGGSSNAITSGGFGANQVSAILGLGILAVFLYLLAGKANRITVGVMLVLILFLTRQCLITMSRGGMYMAVGSIAAASVFLAKDPVARRRLATGLVVIGAIVLLVVVPRLDAITGGVLVSRYENTAGTGRAELIEGDLESWSTSPLFGVGPGLGGAVRMKYFDAAAAHTEYSRLLAEHGFLGLGALILLGAMAVRAIREPRSSRGKAVSAALLTYALLFMAVDATRLVAPAFTFGLACTAIGSRGPRSTSDPRRSS